MGKPNKTVGIEEEEKVYATTSEVEDLKRSTEALKKAQEDSNLQMQLQMDKLMGAMANFMNSPTIREPFDKQSSCQVPGRPPSPPATSTEQPNTSSVPVFPFISPKLLPPTNSSCSSDVSRW